MKLPDINEGNTSTKILPLDQVKGKVRNKDQINQLSCVLYDNYFILNTTHIG